MRRSHVGMSKDKRVRLARWLVMRPTVLNALRERQQTEAQLAHHLRLNEASVYKWFSGGTPTSENMDRLDEWLNPQPMEVV